MQLCFLILAFVAGCFALYPSNSDVIELTPHNFDRLVINSDDVWIVEFFAPWCGHCQQFVPEYQKAAKALKGVIKVGAVNADQHNDLGGRYGVKGFPTVKIFGANKNKPEDYNGDRTAQGLVTAGLSAAKSKVLGKLNGKSGGSEQKDSKDVIELTDSNFAKLVLQSDDMWLVEFFAPWCGHCKNLAPHWAEAASQLSGKVKLGALDATVYTTTASKYGVQGYPTIKYFPPGPKDSSSAQEYDGGRTSSAIVEWALQKLSENVPPPELKQIVSEESFAEACENKQLCVVSVLPNILDCQSECRNAYLELLRNMAEKFKQKPFGWVWSEAGAQLDLEEAVDIGGFGYPAMVVINPKKLKYSILRGPFSETGIKEFMRDVSYGRGNTAPVKGQKLPKIVKTEPWDGKDAELPVEEDIDLSDVQLDDKDEL